MHKQDVFDKISNQLFKNKIPLEEIHQLAFVI